MKLEFYSESGIELLYGTEESAGLDLPIWDARETEAYQDGVKDGGTEEELKNLEGAIEKHRDEMIKTNITLLPGEAKTLKTGIYMKIPEGFYGQLDTRSSTSKLKLDLLCHTIDSDYRGNIRLAIINHDSEPVTLQNGQSIAQIIIKKYEKVELKAVDNPDLLGDTARGVLGFGSTGRNV